MSNLDDQDRLLNGVLRDLILEASEIGDRKQQAATKARSTEDVAVDTARLELSADYKKTLAFLEGTKKKARQLTQDIKRHVSEYDSLND